MRVGSGAPLPDALTTLIGTHWHVEQTPGSPAPEITPKGQTQKSHLPRGYAISQVQGTLVRDPQRAGLKLISETDPLIPAALEFDTVMELLFYLRDNGYENKTGEEMKKLWEFGQGQDGNNKDTTTTMTFCKQSNRRITCTLRY